MSRTGLRRRVALVAGDLTVSLSPTNVIALYAQVTYYMGTVGGGMWKTTDGGVSWNNMREPQNKLAHQPPSEHNPIP